MYDAAPTLNGSFTVSTQGGAGLRRSAGYCERSLDRWLFNRKLKSVSNLITTSSSAQSPICAYVSPTLTEAEQNYKQPSILSILSFSPAGGTHVQLSPPCLGAELDVCGTQRSGDEP